MGQSPFWKGTPISRSVLASCSVHGHIKRKRNLLLVALDRYVLYRIECEIWRWVIYLGSEKQGNFFTKSSGSKTVEILKVSKAPSTHTVMVLLAQKETLSLYIIMVYAHIYIQWVSACMSSGYRRLLLVSTPCWGEPRPHSCRHYLFKLSR
jgi:hypothetical protein